MKYLPMAVPLTVDALTCGTNCPALPLIKKTPMSRDPTLSLTEYSIGSNPNVRTEKNKVHAYDFITIQQKHVIFSASTDHHYPVW